MEINIHDSRLEVCATKCLDVASQQQERDKANSIVDHI
jgi:hypothetical protein